MPAREQDQKRIEYLLKRIEEEGEAIERALETPSKIYDWLGAGPHRLLKEILERRVAELREGAS